ncbi:hypothetical protein CHS0354_012595 [Potamilus streckersoni]|uniref:Uncharacterized protein n=1 Tax=Potamilus streckersoni TaxID=2493646 RepID=A0AAE0SXM0_9BIVA|nr:hypothetical protein CHS0354_012595 [Potamilus streckersoni]
MAIMRRRNILKRVVLALVLVLISYYGILFFADVLRQQMRKVFSHKSQNNMANVSESSKITIAHDSAKEIHISFNGTPPPYENLAEFLPIDGPFKIETIIHQTWINKNVPQDFRKCVTSLKVNHPNYAYMFWTDETALKFVEVMFPNSLPLFINYPRDLQRADAIRYMILYKYGGVYADLDILSLRPLDPILRKYFCVLSQEPYLHPIYYSNFYGLACNAFMACRRHHPFMKILVDNLLSFSVAVETLDSTGPRFVTMLYRNYIAEHSHVHKTDSEGVYLAPPEYFMPSSDPSIQRGMKTLCSKKDLTHLQIWACERLEKHGLGGPTNTSFTDHMWAHVTLSAKKKRKTFLLTEIFPDAIYYINKTYNQVDTNKT